jgi:hypothetical protein
VKQKPICRDSWAQIAHPNTHSFRGQLRCTLKHYYEWQDRINAPLRAIRLPPQPVMVNQALEVEEAKRLVKTAKGWWPEGAAVLFGMYLALRREEIAKPYGNGSTPTWSGTRSQAKTRKRRHSRRTLPSPMNPPRGVAPGSSSGAARTCVIL